MLLNMKLKLEWRFLNFWVKKQKVSIARTRLTQLYHVRAFATRFSMNDINIHGVISIGNVWTVCYNWLKYV